MTFLKMLETLEHMPLRTKVSSENARAFKQNRHSLKMWLFPPNKIDTKIWKDFLKAKDWKIEEEYK